MLGKHGLVTTFVLGFVGFGFMLRVSRVLVALNVRRQRHVAVLLHQGVRLVAELEAEQGAVFGGPTPQQGGGEATVA